MVGRPFPERVDNTHRGHKLALWLFGLLLLVRGTMGINSIVNARSVATTADGIPGSCSRCWGWWCWFATAP